MFSYIGRYKTITYIGQYKPTSLKSYNDRYIKNIYSAEKAFFSVDFEILQLNFKHNLYSPNFISYDTRSSSFKPWSGTGSGIIANSIFRGFV